MRTIGLPDAIVDQRAANSQATAVVYTRGNGSIPGGSGSGITYYNKLETAFGNGGQGGIKKRPRPWHIKRLCRMTGGSTIGWAGVMDCFSGRDNSSYA